MGSFTCYRLHDALNGVDPVDLDDFIEEDERPQTLGPVDMGDFVAKAYVTESVPHNPPWEGFIRSGFTDIENMPQVASTGAVVIVALRPESLYFAFTFGTLGRFLLRPDAWQRSTACGPPST